MVIKSELMISISHALTTQIFMIENYQPSELKFKMQQKDELLMC